MDVNLYDSGSGTTTLTFNYEVDTGQNSSDLNYFSTAALSLNGGTIASSYYSGAGATLTLPALGGAGSLATNKNIIIDTTADPAPGTPDLTAGTDTGTSSTDDLTNDTTPDFAVSCVTGSTVEIFDGVTSLGTGVCAGGTVTITSGSALAEGAHTITANQTDIALNVSVASAGLTVTIDTTGPVAPPTADLTAGSDTGSSSTDDLTSDTTPTLSGAGAIASAPITIYDGVTNVCTTTADGAGDWTCTTSALSGDGSHTITVTQKDAANNESSASAGFSFNLDTTIPTGSYSTATFLNNTAGNQTITFTTADNTGGGGINSDSDITVSDSIMGALVPSCNVVGGFPTTSDTSITCTVDISTALNSEETHVLTTTVVDRAGKSKMFNSPNYIIDRKGPTFTSLSVDPISITPVDFSDPYISFTAYHGVAMDHFEVNPNAAGYTTQTSPYAMTGASSTSTNTVLVKAYDTAGNTTIQSVSFYPSVIISAPTTISNTTITNTTINIVGPYNIDTAPSTYNGGGVTLTCAPGLGGVSSNINCTVDGDITVTGTLSISATDMYPNSGATSTQGYTIETVLPVITATTPTLISQSTITDASFTITDVSGFTSVTFTGGGNNFTCSDGSLVVFPTTSNSVTCTGDITTTGTLAIVATDRAGNVKNLNTDFYVDSTDPEL